MLCGQWNVILGQNSASTQPANSVSLLRRNGHYLSCVSLASTLHKQMFKAAKKLTELLPRVPQTDAILFIVPCQRFSQISHGKMRISSQPMECKMAALMIDGSNVWWAICTKIMIRYTCGFSPRILAIFSALWVFSPSMCPFSSHASVPHKHTLNKHADICT